MPVYVITVTPKEPTTRLVSAKNRAQAIAHVIDRAVSAEVPTPQEILTLGAAGAVIEMAGEDVKKAAE